MMPRVGSLPVGISDICQKETRSDIRRAGGGGSANFNFRQARTTCFLHHYLITRFYRSPTRLSSKNKCTPVPP